MTLSRHPNISRWNVGRGKDIKRHLVLIYVSVQVTNTHITGADGVVAALDRLPQQDGETTHVEAI